MTKIKSYLNTMGILSLPIVFFLLTYTYSFSQGYNHAWLLGYGNWINKGRINITNNNLQLSIEQRSMEFSSTQGNISDANGNFIMSSNGVWIANKNNSLMLNGSGLNPNSFTSSWSTGLPLSNGNLVIPWPDDTTKYVLFHQTGYYDPNYSQASRELYYSVIDITGDNGNGEVIEKNIKIINDTLGWGLSACKHANGRDWWIVALGDSGSTVHKVLLTPDTILYMGEQILSVPAYRGYGGQPVFSSDGTKFAFMHGLSVSGVWTHNIRFFNFDRCNGDFFNLKLIDISDGNFGFGISFSPNSKYLYASKFDKVLQLNTDTTNIAASLDTVAVYDGFISGWPPGCCATDFWLMYLAANGKIYITSGNGVQHIHYVDNPDLDGLACDVIQHGLDLNGVWHNRSVPVHPNYYLGAVVGSLCDSLTSVTAIEHDFKFNIYPNPSSGNFNIIYMLPHNKEGKLEVLDITGKVVYEMRLPQWSTLQQISLPNYISNGLYNCAITAGNYRTSKKIAIINP
jgi:hypothetical protein